ncbi:kinase-like protein [Trematosphaeria pertusa]|uniref:Kinase-like protein n=1 Tax=Trematosphaeria pertusa TaxID=390896 RepID=A0A6A6IMY9_9PLEO|nr:kinase-like protein [Trematosphaeria pertusa]KAF2251609.1 kinase-like protein [Trematosphaeria pertusa]
MLSGLEEPDWVRFGVEIMPISATNAKVRSRRRSAIPEPDQVRGERYYNEGKYKDAERLFRRVAGTRKKERGRLHEATLYTQHWLACSLFGKKSYEEAEELARVLAQNREDTFGKEDKGARRVRALLAYSLFMQGKYTEVKSGWGKVVRRHSRVLGKTHEETLSGKILLGATLRGLEEFQEAEIVLREVKEESENAFGKQSVYAKRSNFQLGLVLLDREQWQEAEAIFRELAIDVGGGSRTGLELFNGLARSLLGQRNYGEAEEIFRELVGFWDKWHNDRSWSDHNKLWLADALWAQRRYKEAKSLCREVLEQDMEETYHNPYDKGEAMAENRARADKLLQRVLEGERISNITLKPSSLVGGPDAATQIIEGRLRSLCLEAEDAGTYTDAQILEVSSLLERFNMHWSSTPRTYIILWKLGLLNLIDDVIDTGFSDFHLPVTERGLPSFIAPNDRRRFVATQGLVLTQSMDLEKGKNSDHCRFEEQTLVPFERLALLGRGGDGEVDKVLSRNTARVYARKIIPRRKVFRKKKDVEEIIRFEEEIRILKRLSHHHVVQFVGSYTDPKFLGLIMTPVAEMDLSKYLSEANSSKYSELRTFFGCLAHGLEYLHYQNVRHKDIKPQNILVHQGRILFTDFGLSFDFTDATGSTTVSMVNGMTPRYCAPEVAERDPRNTSSDIWSLGSVFLDMVVALKGRTIRAMEEYLLQSGTQYPYVRMNRPAFLMYLTDLRGDGDVDDNIATEWIEKMLDPTPSARPTAASLVGSIEDCPKFYGVCCAAWEDEGSIIG